MFLQAILTYVFNWSAVCAHMGISLLKNYHTQFHLNMVRVTRNKLVGAKKDEINGFEFAAGFQ
mgnify:CR=1 FL=1